jgi:hypothetical protein
MGRQKELTDPPRIFTKSQTYIPAYLPTTFLFSSILFLGEFKNTIKKIAKSPCRKPFPKQSGEKSMSVFPRLFFCFIAFSGVSQRREFKNTNKKVLQKNRFEKFLQKKRRKIQNQCFLHFLLSRFLAFIGEGSSKTLLKQISRKTPLTLVLFWSLTYRPTHGRPRFFFAGPCFFAFAPLDLISEVICGSSLLFTNNAIKNKPKTT